MSGEYVNRNDYFSISETPVNACFGVSEAGALHGYSDE